MAIRTRVWFALLLVSAGLTDSVAAQDSGPPLVQIGGALFDLRGKPVTGQQPVTTRFKTRRLARFET